MQSALSFETSGSKPLQESPGQHTLLQRKSPLPANQTGRSRRWNLCSVAISLSWAVVSLGSLATAHLGLLLQAGGPWCFCTLFVLCFLWAETPIFLRSATPTWPAASKIKRTVDDLHVVDLIMDFPGCHIVLPPQGNNGRPEILKFSLMFMLSHSQNVWQAIPIGSMYAIYGNIYHQYTPNVSIYIYIPYMDPMGIEP